MRVEHPSAKKQSNALAAHVRKSTFRLTIKGHVSLGLFTYMEYASIPDCALPAYTAILPCLYKRNELLIPIHWIKGWNCCTCSMNLLWTAMLLFSSHLFIMTGAAFGICPIITSAGFLLTDFVLRIPTTVPTKTLTVLFR